MLIRIVSTVPIASPESTHQQAIESESSVLNVLARQPRSQLFSSSWPDRQAVCCLLSRATFSYSVNKSCHKVTVEGSSPGLPCHRLRATVPPDPLPCLTRDVPGAAAAPRARRHGASARWTLDPPPVTGQTPTRARALPSLEDFSIEREKGGKCGVWC